MLIAIPHTGHKMLLGRPVMNEAILNVVLWSDQTEPQAPSDLREADNFDTHIFFPKSFLPSYRKSCNSIIDLSQN